jgi:hypothetical protein
LGRVWHLIFSAFDGVDLWQFRLTCKAFSNIGAPYIHQTVRVIMKKEVLEGLRQISMHPVFSYHVASIIFVATKPRIEPAKGFEELNYNAACHYLGRISKDPTAAPTNLEKRAQLEKFQRYIDEWGTGVEQYEDPAALSELICRLPRLRHIEISFVTPVELESFVGVMMTMEESMQQAYRQLTLCLEAVSKSLARPVALRVGLISWKIFDTPPANILMSTVAPLESLSLRICVDSCTPGAEWCRATIEKGIMRTFLSAQRHLRCLEVHFQPFTGTTRTWRFAHNDVKYPACLTHVLQPGHKWHSLRSLSLKHIDCRREDLIAVFDLHRDTLRELTLDAIKMVNTSVKTLISSIANTLDLHVCDVSGFMRGTPEDSNSLEVEENFLLTPLEYPNSKDFYLTIALNNFCCGIALPPELGSLDEVFSKLRRYTDTD